MASKELPVTLMLAGNFNENTGKYEVHDPVSAGGKYVTISCHMGRERKPFPTTGDPVLAFEPGETVEVEVEISLHDGKEHLAAQAKELDSALNELVDFTKGGRLLNTQILMQLVHANSITLTYQMPIPKQPAEDASELPQAAPASAGEQERAQASVPEADRLAVRSAEPAAAAPSVNTKQLITRRSTMLMASGSAGQDQPPLDPIGASSGPADGDYKTSKTINLQRTTRPLTGDVALWLLIKLNADMLSWTNYASQIDALFFPGGSAAGDSGTTGQAKPLRPHMLDGTQQLSRRRFLPFTDTDAYRALKVATEAFVVTWGGVVPRGPDLPQIATLLAFDPEALRLANERLGLTITAEGPLGEQYFGKTGSPTLPYLRRVVQALQGTDAAASAEEAFADATRNDGAGMGCREGCLWLEYWNNDISAKLAYPPLIELIWSYWMEEMQLVQTMNAISRRFQNVSSGPRDPLNQIELDALRPLNNLIWGWVQDEQHRLPIERRAAEYQHEYGFRLIGRAVPKMHAADNRSKFLAAFHTLLNLCVPFFRQADDTTVVPDGFPLLNALREVHLILSEGAHNQFRDMPTTSRVEMMMQQWLLARPEFREYLPRRAMVAYPEPWMHSVESMRKLQGWGDTNTYQFWQLATTGEQIVSSIRWSDWNSVNDPVNAANWAAFFRPEIQTYIHSYRAVTGIDVGAEPVDVQVPGMHLLRRLNEQKGIKVA
jgi:hypothetical protein